jgi:hypothetical protein
VIDQRAGTDCGFGSGCGALFSVNPVTGNRVLVSDFGNALQGPTGLLPWNIAFDANGQLLVTDQAAPFIINSNFSGSVFRVDGGCGNRSVLSDFTNPAQGPLASRPSGVAGHPSGTLVTDPFLGRLLRIDPVTGARTILSDFHDASQGPLGSAPMAVTHDVLNNRILVADQVSENLRQGDGALFIVDANGHRTMLSDFTEPAQGPLGSNLSGVAVTVDGEILVIDFDAGTNSRGALFRVNCLTGQRSYLSDFGNPAQGPHGVEPSGLVIVPGAPALLAMASAVVPTSRSVQTGTPATAFVTIINAGCIPAVDVGIAVSPATPVPVTFAYQTTNPLTNVTTGTPNTPVTIPPGGSQTFVIGLTPTAAFPPTDVQFIFAGSNTLPVPTLIGVNTLLLSASDTPVPDIVALAATVNNDLIVNVPGATGVGAFSVATVNVGVGGQITASADTAGVALPVSLALCLTDPMTAVCTSAIGPSVTTQIDAGGTPTFAVFVTGTGVVPFDPARNRVFVRFTDAGGITRGATSVAVRTQ